jgi:hypothetical protein
MIQDPFLRIIVFARPSFRRKPKSRLNDFAWIPARAQLGRDDADLMDLSLETTGRGAKIKNSSRGSTSSNSSKCIREQQRKSRTN